MFPCFFLFGGGDFIYFINASHPMDFQGMLIHLKLYTFIRVHINEGIRNAAPNAINPNESSEHHQNRKG